MIIKPGAACKRCSEEVKDMEKIDISVERLGQLGVYDEQGASSPLAELWAEQAAALVFVRHFG